MIKNKDYRYSNMANAVKNIVSSFELHPDKWSFQLHRTNDTSVKFHSSYLLLATYEDLPCHEFMVSHDAQYFYCDMEHFFDLVDKDEYLGEYPISVFSHNQKETLYRALVSSFSINSIIEKLCRENNVMLNPFKSVEQANISDAFSRSPRKSVVETFMKPEREVV